MPWPLSCDFCRLAKHNRCLKTGASWSNPSKAFGIMDVSLCLWLYSWRRCTRPHWCSCSQWESGAPTWTPWSSTPNCNHSRPALGTGLDCTGSAPRLCRILKKCTFVSVTGELGCKAEGQVCRPAGCILNFICVWLSGWIHQRVRLHYLLMGERRWSVQ